MASSLLLSTLGLLAAPGLLRRLARRLPPAEWAGLCVALLAAGAIALEVLTLLVAAPTVMRAVGLHAIADLCQEALGRLIPGGTLVGWGAAAVAVTIPVLAGREIVRTRRIRRMVRAESMRGEQRAWGARRLVVVPSDGLVAFSVPGPAPGVVISKRLAEDLSQTELAAVLQHELAHLSNRHHHYLLLASVLDRSLGLIPLVTRSTMALRAALERWADEQAATASAGGRASVRAALLRVATAMVEVDPRLAAFLTPSTVLERLEALQHERPARSLPRRVLVHATSLLLLILVPVLVAGIIGQAEVLHHLAGLCHGHGV